MSDRAKGSPEYLFSRALCGSASEEHGTTWLKKLISTKKM